MNAVENFGGKQQVESYVPTIWKMVFSDYTKYRILLLRLWENRASGISRLRRSEGIQRESASVFKVFIKVQTKRHNC